MTGDFSGVSVRVRVRVRVRVAAGAYHPITVWQQAGKLRVLSSLTLTLILTRTLHLILHLRDFSSLAHDGSSTTSTPIGSDPCVTIAALAASSSCCTRCALRKALTFERMASGEVAAC